MIVRRDSKLLRVLMWVNSPTQHLPRLFPLWVMPARVQYDCSTFVTVTFRQPHILPFE
jgi:hypothetical protein